MARSRTARVDLEVGGLNKVRNSLRGATSAWRTSQRDMRDAAVRASREAANAARATGEVQKTAAKQASDVVAREAAEGARAIKAAEREKQRAIKDTAREAERTARAQARADAQQAAAASRARAGRRAAIGGAIVGGAVAAHGQITALGGAIGVRSREENINAAIQNTENLTRLGVQAGLQDTERAALQERLLSTSDATGASLEDLIAGLSTAQDTFNQFRFFEQNMDAIARAARAGGSSTSDVIGVLGEFQRQMGVTAAEVPELLNVLQATGKEGAISSAGISAHFGSTIGTVSGLTGRKGIGAAREALALFQSVGQGEKDPAKAATLVDNLVGALQRSEVQRGLQRAGVQMYERGPDGQQRMRALNDIINDASRSRRLQTGAGLQSVFHDMQARTAFGILTRQARRAHEEGRATDMERLSGIDQGIGQRVTDDFLASFGGTAAGQAQRAATRANNEFVRNQDPLIQFAADIAGPTAELKNEFPRLTMAVETLTGVIGGGMIGKIFGGGGLSSLFGGGTAAGATGTAATVGSRAATLLGAARLATGVGAFVAASEHANAGETFGRGASDRISGGPGLSNAALDIFNSLGRRTRNAQGQMVSDPREMAARAEIQRRMQTSGLNAQQVRAIIAEVNNRPLNVNVTTQGPPGAGTSGTQTGRRDTGGPARR